MERSGKVVIGILNGANSFKTVATLITSDTAIYSKARYKKDNNWSFPDSNYIFGHHPCFQTNIDHPEASKIIYLGSYKYHYQYQFQWFRMIGRDFHFEAFIFKYICSHLKKYKRQSSSAERWQERKRMSFLKAPKTQVSGKPCWRGRVFSCWTSTQAGPGPPPPSTSSSTSSTSNFRCSSSQTKSCQVKTGKEVKFLSVNCYAVPELEMFKGQCHPVFVMISQGKTTSIYSKKWIRLLNVCEQGNPWALSTAHAQNDSR